jgi:hypothetical protein
MSSFDRRHQSLSRWGGAGFLALLAALALGSGCTVRPLYADAGLETGGVLATTAGFSRLRSIL